MSTDLDPVAVLARTDPAADLTVPEPPPLDELASLPTAAAGTDRRPLLAAAVVLVALLAAAAVLAARATGDRTEVPAAPTTTAPGGMVPVVGEAVPIALGPAGPGAPALLALADRAALDAEPVRFDRVAYHRSVGWGVLITGDGPDPRVELQAEQVESWLRPDQPQTYRRARTTVADAGGVGPVPPDLAPPPLDRALESGPIFPTGPWVLSSSVEEVRADLVEPRGEAEPDVLAVERAVDLLAQPLSGPDRATLLRALATLGTIEDRGEVADRAGRPGQAVSVPLTDDRGRRHSELVVVLDADTGTLLATESVTLTGGPELRIPTPLVNQSSTVLATGWVDEVGDRLS